MPLERGIFEGVAARVCGDVVMSKSAACGTRLRVSTVEVYAFVAIGIMELSARSHDIHLRRGGCCFSKQEIAHGICQMPLFISGNDAHENFAFVARDHW